MKKTLLILLAFACLFALQGQTASELYSKLQSAYKNISSFQADLQQSNYYPQLKKTVTYSGKIYFTPGRMLMKFTKPSEQYLKIENNRVELYDAASNTLFQSAVQPQFGRMNPVEILQLYWDKSTVSVTSTTKSAASVKLVPKQDDLVTSLTATLNPSTGIVSRLGYTDKSGNSVTYSFSSIKQNASIPASVWQVNPPKNVQIIK
ncbi:MAG: outer membrane lipoprotein carrier protein LolA [Candidatus Cloacimonetes bacterium]|nr:outer membrane lipoprotein carrier protein LolA [Candidatus Cloacimonadota bacterium]